MAGKKPFQLMSAARVNRALNRIARQILEDTRGEGNIILFGIGERGEKLATILSSTLQDIQNRPIPFYKISGKHRDKDPIKLDVDITGSHLIIIDDVIFSGKSMHQAFEQVMNLGEPERVKLAVLVDRGHRLYPIEAQYIGIESSTKLNEQVVCTFDNGMPDSVWLKMDDHVSNS